jgi:hypothetical protein
LSAEWWGVILQAITVFAVGFAAFQLMFHSRQMHRDLEMAYVGRYWSLMDERSLEFVRSEQVSDRDRVVIFKYLQLCEDELDLRQIARVTDNTWGFWSQSMYSQLDAAPYRNILQSLDSTMFPHVRRLLEAGPDYDPLQKSTWWRRTRGL